MSVRDDVPRRTKRKRGSRDSTRLRWSQRQRTKGANEKVDESGEREGPFLILGEGAKMLRRLKRAMATDHRRSSTPSSRRPKERPNIPPAPSAIFRPIPALSRPHSHSSQSQPGAQARSDKPRDCCHHDTRPPRPRVPSPPRASSQKYTLQCSSVFIMPPPFAFSTRITASASRLSLDSTNTS
ncbi:hypothetical protein OH77DRAFT_12983 [Trametes cingulata]|nr:hypothetical protein OH77DRAFT_12983 [Trametes cingulata]